MAKLKIHIKDEGGKTVSKFGVTKNDKIVFHNKGSDTLNVTILEPDALCDGNGNAVNNFDVTLAEKKETYEICSGYQAETFKYEATIVGSLKEDPIVIIERANFLEHPAAQVGIGVVIGAVVAVAVMKMKAGKTRPAA